MRPQENPGCGSNVRCYGTGFVGNLELMFDNVLKFNQPEAAAQSRMKDGQCFLFYPKDRIENCKHLKKT